MKLATANYPPERLPGWEAYRRKAGAWVAAAARAGADLLVFPEYAGMEAPLCLTDATRDTADWCHAAAKTVPSYLDLWQGLARHHGVHILAGSLPAPAGKALVNRAFLIAPDGGFAHQDKQILTKWERAHTPLSPGDGLAVFDTALGRIGVLICYDGEFPLQGRAVVCDLLLVPSCTDALTGLTRVQVGARARALEGATYAALATLTGAVPGCELIDENRGQAAVYAPPDRGFPAEGIVAQGARDEAGWIFADLDLSALPELRRQMEVDVPAHWPEQARAAEGGRGAVFLSR